MVRELQNLIARAVIGSDKRVLSSPSPALQENSMEVSAPAKTLDDSQQAVILEGRLVRLSPRCAVAHRCPPSIARGARKCAKGMQSPSYRSSVDQTAAL